MALLTDIGFWLLSKKEPAPINKQFINWELVSSIVLIIDTTQINDISEFIDTCKKENISVSTFIIYEGKPEDIPNPNFEHIILDKKSFTLFGLPKENLQQQKETDILINLGDEWHLKSTALSKLTPATCKVSKFSNTIFDVTISTNNNDREYLKQVITYLNMIKTI